MLWLFPTPLPGKHAGSGGRRRNRMETRPFANRGATKETHMRYLIAAGGLALMLLGPSSVSAQQGRQATDDQASFSQSVKALPSTHKRRNIIRAERSTRTNKPPGTVGAAPR